ncbi:Ankyrin-3-like protein 2 [Colletotrichum chlorophyti]|uniref:Ankyrin-3-like protein 2 n=1 Tax=Colletotrichum chlorophyti TaxID=708187 RepID=A0A1Q8S811_9PEZI|nr:Ankyrin-3-like protein 2 [Colletotrichum chlorophyti]
MEVPRRHLAQVVADAQAKTRSTYGSVRRSRNERLSSLASPLRLLSGFLHSISLFLEDAATERASFALDRSLLDTLTETLDDVSVILTLDLSEQENGGASLENVSSRIYQLKLRFNIAAQCDSEAALLVALSESAPRDRPLDPEPGAAPSSSANHQHRSCTNADFAALECVRTLLSPEFDHKLDESYLHPLYITQRNTEHPRYPESASHLPDHAHHKWETVEKDITVLFQPHKTSSFQQWLLEYARQQWPDQLDTASGALSASTLLRSLSIVSDSSLSTLHVAAALGLPELCRRLIAEGQDVNQPGPLGAPVYCALLGPSALLARLDDPVQLLAHPNHRPGIAQVETIGAILDAGASCKTEFPGPNQQEEFSLATLAFVVCQSLEAPGVLERILALGANLDSRFTQLFHGKDSLMHYWPSSLPKPTRSFLEEALPVVLDHAVAQYDVYNDISELSTGVFDIMSHFDIPYPTPEFEARKLNTPDAAFKDLAIEAVRQGELVAVKRLVLDPRWEPNVFVEDSEKQTFLHVAVQNDDADLVAAILSSRKEVDVHARNTKGQTPIMLSESPQVLKLLLKYGGMTTDTDREGRNVWHIAAANSDLPLIDCLYENDLHWNENLQCLTNDGHTPITYGITYAFEQLTRHSVGSVGEPAGALHMLKICPKDSAYLQSPRPLLFLAAEWGLEGLASALLAFRSIDASFADADGRSALHWLNVSATESLVRKLQRRCHAPLQTTEGQTPAETIFLCFNELLAETKPQPHYLRNHPALCRPLRAAVYEQILTDQVLMSKDGKGAGLWERFATTIVSDWAFRWPDCDEGGGRSLLVALECLINKGALDMYERETGNSGLAPVLAGWLRNMEDLDQLPPHFETAISVISQASNQGSLIEDSEIAVKSLQLAIKKGPSWLVDKFLEQGVPVHTRVGSAVGTSAIEFVCEPYSFCDIPTFNKVLDHASPNRINEVDSRGVGLLEILTFNGVSQRDYKLVALIFKGCNPNMRSSKGDPMVVTYIKNLQIEAALLLLHAGADPSACNDAGLNAALAASLVGSVAVLKKIVEKRPDFDWQKSCTHQVESCRSLGSESVTWRNCNALHLAASNGHTEAVNFLIGLGLDMESTTLDSRWRPLHFGAASGTAECVRVLLEHGADPRAAAKHGHTPLMMAAMAPNNETARLLLELCSKDHGDIGIPEAFVRALKLGSMGVTQLFKPFLMTMVVPLPKTSTAAAKSAGGTRAHVLGAVLESLIADGDIEGCRKVLEVVELSLLNSTKLSCGKCSPVVFAAGRGQFVVATLFLEAGLSTWDYPEHCRRHFESLPYCFLPACNALHIASMWHGNAPSTGLTTLVKRLLDLVSWESSELSPIHCSAVTEDSTKMTRLLIKYGADVNRMCEDGKATPLHEAAAGNFIVPAKILLENGANPNLRNSQSQTPLTVAVEQGHLEMAKLLVRHGANIHIQDSDGMSLLNTCGEESRDPAMFVWLMCLGLNPYRLDKAGYTPVHDIVLHNEFSALAFNYGFDFSNVADLRKGFISLIIEFNQQTANSVLLRLFKRLPRERSRALVNSNPSALVSALCNAVLRDELACIPTLLHYGADVDADGSEEGSALMVACSKGSFDAASLLLQHGAKISYLTTVDGRVVLRNALERARPFPDIVHWLLVGRYTFRRRIGVSDVQVGAAEEEMKPWSGGQVVGFRLSGVGNRAARGPGESSLEFLRRLDQIRRSLQGQTVRVVPLDGHGEDEQVC